MPTSAHSNVVMEACWSQHCLVQYCQHHGLGPMLPPLYPQAYTAQLPPLDFLEIRTSVVDQSYLCHGGDSNPHPSIRGNSTQPLLLGRLHLASQLIYPCRDEDLNPRPSHQRDARLILRDQGNLDKKMNRTETKKFEEFGALKNSVIFFGMIPNPP